MTLTILGQQAGGRNDGGAGDQSRVHIRRLGGLRGAGVDDLKFATLNQLWWFNNIRLHGEIGQVPPSEYKATYYRQNNAQQQPLRGEPSLQRTRALQTDGRQHLWVGRRRRAGRGGVASGFRFDQTTRSPGAG
jgi:hypothetical protein